MRCARRGLGVKSLSLKVTGLGRHGSGETWEERNTRWRRGRHSVSTLRDSAHSSIQYFFILTVTWLRQLNAVETSQMYFDLDQKADMAEHYVPFAHVQRKHKTCGHGVSEFLQGNQNFSFTCSPLSNVFLSEYQAREITRWCTCSGLLPIF